MDGAEPFHRCACRVLWGGVVDGRDRLPRSSAGNHPGPRARFNSQEGSWARLEGKVISSVVCRRDPCNVTCNLDRSGDLCVGCTDLADSGPASKNALPLKRLRKRNNVSAHDHVKDEWAHDSNSHRNSKLLYG